MNKPRGGHWVNALTKKPVRAVDVERELRAAGWEFPAICAHLKARLNTANHEWKVTG